MSDGYKRNIYLSKMPLPEARRLVRDHFNRLFPISRVERTRIDRESEANHDLIL